jgi:hypothetical protein
MNQEQIRALWADCLAAAREDGYYDFVDRLALDIPEDVEIF